MQNMLLSEVVLIQAIVSMLERVRAIDLHFKLENFIVGTLLSQVLAYLVVIASARR